MQWGIKPRTSKGSAFGVDVFASKDGLGLEDPLIFVEVKHRKEKMNTKDIRAFLGGRKKYDKCLYISSGGFTKEAKYEAARAKTHLRLIDFDDLANLVIDMITFPLKGNSFYRSRKY